MHNQLFINNEVQSSATATINAQSDQRHFANFCFEVRKRRFWGNYGCLQPTRPITCSRQDSGRWTGRRGQSRGSSAGSFQRRVVYMDAIAEIRSDAKVRGFGRQAS